MANPKIADLDSRLNTAVAGMLPRIQDERSSLGLWSPDCIYAKSDILSPGTVARYFPGQDFVRINVMPFFDTANRFSRSEVLRARDFASATVFIRCVSDASSPETLEELDSLLSSPDIIKSHAFEYLPPEFQEFYCKMRDSVLEHRKEFKTSLDFVAAQALKVVDSPRIEEGIYLALRHEVEHYVSDNKYTAGLHRQVNEATTHIRSVLKSGSLSELDWKETQQLFRSAFIDRLRTSAEQESMAFFFTNVPPDQWTEDAIKAAAVQAKAQIDLYNPKSFLDSALDYFVARENSARMQGGRTDLIHPLGHEYCYIIGKIIPELAPYYPKADPQKTDMRFVARVLYTELPKLQHRFSHIVDTSVDTNRDYLRDAIRQPTTD
jgi:hypothetical protein